MIPPRIVERFHISTRSRGADYYKRGRVTIDSSEPGTVRATVRGTERYNVRIETADPNWRFHCDCPFDRGPCKHMWSVLLAADQRGLLGTDPDADIAGASRVVHVPEWKRHLQLLRRRTGYEWEEAQSAIPWPDDRRIVYLLNLDESRGFGGVIVDVKSERIDPAQRTHPFHFDDNAWLHAPDPIDREIASLLLGSHDPWGSSGQRRSFRIPTTMYETTLRRIVESQRCFAYSRNDGWRSEEPMRWDDGPPWQVRVRVVPHIENTWRVIGEMERNGETRELAEKELLFTAGYVLSENGIAHVKLEGAWRLVQALREGPPLIAAQHELFELTAELALLGGSAVELPPGIHIERVSLVPRNRLRLRTIERPWRVHGLLEAQLGFDYGGITVGFQRGDAALIDREGARIIDRDLVAEHAALNRLIELGVRREMGIGGPPRLSLPARALPQLVSDLASEGWEVEAEGKRYRAADRRDVKVTSGVDWFELSGAVQFGDQTASLPRLLAALRRKENTVLLDDGTLGVLPAEWLQRFATIASAAHMHDDQDVLRFTHAQTGLLDALLATLPEASFDETFARIRSELATFDRIEPADPPSTFTGTLRQYQREGVGWMLFLERFGLGGCLADDMGLGKTVQVLALLDRRRADEQGPSLVVVPRSLIFNWASEAARFAPELRIRDYTGASRTKEPLDPADFDLLLTTYGTLRRDVPRLREIEFDYIVLDESQAIKNANTASAKAARLLRGNNRLALSGTPIENRIDELWSLFDFLNPGMLGSSAAFRQLKTNENRAMLAQSIKPFILRRTKEMVAPELPPRLEQTLIVELDTEQRALYNELRDHYRRNLLGPKEKTEEPTKFEVLEALLRLRQAALHPALIDPKHSAQASAKLDMLESQLQDIVAEGHRALVFSQFTTFLSLVRQRLDKQEIAYEYLDGRTTDRQERVQRFQSDSSIPVFLISLRAGGYGLNLTAADYVFVLDPWWNPAVENQAIDRAHRIGQERPVFAMRLIARDTVEEKVLELQQKKRELVDAIIGEDSGALASIGREELEILLS